MDEEIIIEPEFIEAAKAELLKNPKLQPCQLCMHYDPEKHWCERFGQQKMPYNYGSNCFLTNEVALRALLLQERKRSSQRGCFPSVSRRRLRIVIGHTIR